MRARQLAMWMGLCGVLGTCALAQAQSFGTVPTQYFHVEASVGPVNGASKAFCGYLYNDRHVPARNVRIRVTGLDTTRSAISSGDRDIVGDIPASGRAYFCVQVAAEANTYGFAVLSADWGFGGGQ